jgi:stage V sporulation protein B
MLSNKFASDVGLSFFATIFSVIIGFPISIILGRYLGPGELGIYSMTITIFTIVNLIGPIGIPSAVVNYVAESQEDEEHTSCIISSSIYASIFLGFTSFAIIFLFSNTIANFFKMPELFKLIRIISFALPFSVVSQALLGASNGFRQMKIYTFNIIIQSMLTLCTALLLVYLGYGVSGVVSGIVISSIGSCVYLTWYLRKYFRKVSISKIIGNSKILLSFGSQTLIANSINLVNYNADIVMVGFFLNPIAVGLYGVAVSFAKLLWLIPNSIQTITYPMISEYHGKKTQEPVGQLVIKTMKYTACILMILVIAMVIYGKLIITSIYGNKFIESASPFYIIITGIFVFGITKSVNSLFASIGRVDLFAKMPTLSATVNFILNLLLIPLYGINGAAFATLVSLLIYAVFMIYYMKKIIGIVHDTVWYAKVGIFMILLVFINNIFVNFITIYFSGLITLLIGIVLIWSYLLTSEDRKFLMSLVS